MVLTATGEGNQATHLAVAMEVHSIQMVGGEALAVAIEEMEMVTTCIMAETIIWLTLSEMGAVDLLDIYVQDIVKADMEVLELQVEALAMEVEEAVDTLVGDKEEVAEVLFPLQLLDTQKSDSMT